MNAFKIEVTKNYATRIYRKTDKEIYLNMTDVRNAVDSELNTSMKGIDYNYLHYIVIDKEVYADAISAYCYLKTGLKLKTNQAIANRYINYLINEGILPNDIKDDLVKDFKPVKTFMYNIKKKNYDKALASKGKVDAFIKSYPHVKMTNLHVYRAVIEQVTSSKQKSTLPIPKLIEQLDQYRDRENVSISVKSDVLKLTIEINF